VRRADLWDVQSLRMLSWEPPLMFRDDPHGDLDEGHGV
jgi:hypothetical protein